MSVVLFGDQTGLDYDFLLKSLRGTQKSLVVAAFLDGAAAILRQEITELSLTERDGIPNFSTIQELVERISAKDTGHPALETALLCISQFVNFFEYHEASATGGYIPPGSHIIGLCIGSLTAAAVSSSRSTGELLPLASETVGIAFRVGLESLRTAQLLHTTSTSKESWSLAFPGVDEMVANVALGDFARETDIPKPSLPYISAISPNSITVSGPPTSLERLLENQSTFRGAKLDLPLHAPYHAPALFEQLDARKIALGRHARVLVDVNTHEPQYILYSTSSGQPYSVTNPLYLFTQIIQEILSDTLRWDLLLATFVSKADVDQSALATVTAFGPTKAAKSLVSRLQPKIGNHIVLHDASWWASRSQQDHSHAYGNFRQSKLAIVGIAGRFPGSSNHEEFWELLEQGLDVHKEIPSDRFDAKAHVDPDGKKRNTSHTPYGCFIDNPGHFDPRFFNMSPREAAQTDPMQRLALVTAFEALEMAGYVPNRTASSTLDRVGTFYGQTSDDYRETNASQDVDTYFITGGIRAFGPGRINYHFKFSGPSFNVDTACSSSLAAIQLACTSLWSGDCDMAVAGGLSVLTSPDLYAGLSRGQFLSKTGSCKTFDNAADGYCRGDSVATVILKRFDDAISDRDNILGVILGAATNHSADAISITHPHAPTQEQLYRKVLSQGGISALDVDYVEMHGTGTQAGDGAEMESISNVFAPESHGRTSHNPLYVGSVKANVGHGEAASGVTALIKSLLMFQKDTIPPHAGIKGLINQGFPDLDERNIRIAMSKTPFKARSNERRRLLVNNFSAAGGNTALLLEDFAKPDEAVPDPRSAHPVVISAKSQQSLKKNVEQLISYLTAHPHTSLADVSYTTTARRIQHNLRVAVSGTTLKQVNERLLFSLNKLSSSPSPKPDKIAFAFTGQGAYYLGLGKDLFESSKRFRLEIESYDSLVRSHGGPSILPLFGVESETAQDSSPVVIQTFLVCIQIALYSLWRSWGVTPDVVVGHSLGEYAALYAAGVLSKSDAIFLVIRRAQLLEVKCTAGTHSMLAIKSSVSSVKAIVAEKNFDLEVACINGPSETVLSGKSKEVDSAQRELTQRNYKCTRLEVPFAFHSSQVDPILGLFEAQGRSIKFNAPNIPIISPLLGDVLGTDDVVTPKYLCRHARETVNFEAALNVALKRGLIGDASGWIEIGPHPICLGMINAITKPALSVPSLRRKENAWETLANSAQELYARGVELDWASYHQEFAPSLNLLELPTYAFEEKNYWLEYKNNWCLTKGQTNEAEQDTFSPKFSTTTLQRVVSEEFSDDKASVVFESDFKEPLLHAAVLGHLVNDSGLCPSSIYADMAMTAAQYIHDHWFPSSAPPGLNVKAMEVSKPVIVSPEPTGEPQLLQITATADFATKKVDIEYNSVDVRNRSRISNAHCFVEIGDAAEWSSHWARSAYLIESRIRSLESEVAGGNVQRILRGMAYKLFSALVQYADAYRGMEEVLLLSSQREAASKVKFQADTKQGEYHFSPYWIDSLAHLSGFVLNANDALDSKTRVYISHGWESMRFVGSFSSDNTYRTYVKMQPEANSTVMAGDVYVFDGNVVVGLIEGLKFQQVPRTVLDQLLPPARRPAIQTKIAATKSPRAPAAKEVVVQSRPLVVDQANVVTSMNGATLPSIADRVIEIIATEVGITTADLSEHTTFTELGIDSLLSLTIIGKLREELDLQLSQSLFADYENTKALRAYLRQFDAERTIALQRNDTDLVKTAVTKALPTSASTSATSSPHDSVSEVSTVESNTEFGGTDVVKTIIAEEMGLDLQDVPDDTPLGSLGMDSLMSLTILGTLRERTGLDVPQTLLADDPSIRDLEERLNPPPVPPTRKVEEKTLEAASGLQETVAGYYPPASSILLQGSSNSSKETLFLFPDGSGSATSYASVPTLRPDLAVVGLNSPFLKSPLDYTCGISGVAQIYITEIKRRQPKGPYLLGGWSVGGIIAYDAAYQLVQNGESVKQLFLLDSPCPLLLPPLPISLVRFFDSLGLFGQGQSPPWLLQHFDSSVANLHRYKPEPIDPSKAPTTFAIWARDGVCKDPADPRPGLTEDDSKSKSWILDNRTDFGPNSWDELVGKENISGVGVSGNHFTMMQEPNVVRLSQQIVYALSQGAVAR